MSDVSFLEIMRIESVRRELISVANNEDAEAKLKEITNELMDKASIVFQNNEHHMQTVKKHIGKCVKIAYEKYDDTTFLPLLPFVAYLHDLGKVVDGGYDDFETKEDGMIYAKHFFKHPIKSVEIAEKMFSYIYICDRWKNDILFIIENHENRFETLKAAKNLFKKADGDFRLLELLVEFQEIDILAQSENVREEKLAINRKSKELIEELKEIINKEEEEKANKITLAINGKDIASKGYVRQEIGNKIKELTEMVKAGKVANTKDELLNLL